MPPYSDKVINVTGRVTMKSSAVRGVRSSLVELYPELEQPLEDLIPKKSTLLEVKCGPFLRVYAVQGDGRPVAFQLDEGQLIPHLSVLLTYPTLMTRVQVDQGAIKFVLRGADIMCPGLTSAGGMLPDNLKEGDVVAVFAEGKQHPLAIGVMKMSSADIRSQNAGIAIENAHHLGDGLWLVKDNIL
nr:translation machinery-associated protein 20 [Andalucia godoyi]|eukprot:ANDGO_00303.mRNA.1 Translation machinery-associated protein 20